MNLETWVALIAALVADAENLTPNALNAAGWTVMIISVGSVLALVSFCLYRVFTLPPVEVEEHFKGPLEIDTHDTLDAD
jgi:hypothetical protein